MNHTKVEFQAERQMHVKTYKELEVVRAKLEQQRVELTDEHRREVQQLQASGAASALEKSKIEQEFRDLTKQFTNKLMEDQKIHAKLTLKKEELAKEIASLKSEMAIKERAMDKSATESDF